MTISQLLQLVIDRNASDLHLVVGYQPSLRINGDLIPVTGSSILTEADLQEALNFIINQPKNEEFKRHQSADFGFNFQKNRFRINVYRQRDSLAIAFRLIPAVIRNISELGLPPTVSKLIDVKQGLVLITGATGQGKSTTLASFINQINHKYPYHITTVEDPIEYIYPFAKSIISQREVGVDTPSWTEALRDVLREDSDVILIGEMRDLETISAAMTIAETSHLVFATLHTNSAAQSIDRVIDVFPEHQQSQIRTQLAGVLEAIISQKLVPTISPGRVMASEVAFGTPAIRSLIRENQTHLIDNVIQTSGEMGMKLLETSLAELVAEGKITSEVAFNHSWRPQLLAKLLNIKH